MNLKRTLFWLAAIFLITVSAVAQTETVLLDFSLFPRGSNKQLRYVGNNAPLVADGAGNFYGTAPSGGLYNFGTVFKLSPAANGGWTQTVIYDFMGGADGGSPQAGLVFDKAGNLYGTAYYAGAGADCCGVVFELSPNNQGGWTETVLHAFTGTEGSFPVSSLTWDAAGNLYGTASYGGASYGGTVYELSPSGNGVWTATVLYSFSSIATGLGPNAGVIFDASGNLYGSTPVYVDDQDNFYPGVVYELSPSATGWTETIIDSANEVMPPGLVPDKSGNLYGAESYENSSSVFRYTLTASGWTKTYLYQFQGGTDGQYPFAGVILDALGNVYGTTYLGGTGRTCTTGCGTVFELTPKSNDTWSERILYSFKGNLDGSFPDSALAVDSSGNLYGSTSGGGIANAGLIFELSRSSGQWKKTSMFQFPGGNGSKPSAGLIADAAGNLYGTTSSGGANNYGSVFQMTRSAKGTWTETLLYSFRGLTDGWNPQSNLVFDSQGNLYGTTAYGGGSCDCGVVYELSPSVTGWKQTVLHAFQGGTNDGSQPLAGVALDSASNLYGTTSTGGSAAGTIFELSPSSGGQWTEKIIHDFLGYPSDGGLPKAGLTIDSAGNLYGTTFSGGNVTYGCDSGCGTLFELSPSANGAWTETILHNFANQNDGSQPDGGLLLASNGSLYGTAGSGGPSRSDCGVGCGLIFQFSPGSGGTWNQTVLHNFVGSDGSYPTAGLIFDEAGNLYGTTVSGSVGGEGEVYELSPSTGGTWTLNVLHSFTGTTDGGVPLGGVVRDSAGNLYGTASIGGFLQYYNGSGVVFEIKP